MLQIPVGSDDLIAIIEPANVKRMKEGKPLVIKLENGSSVMVCFTPDMMALAKVLAGRDINWPGPKEELHLTDLNITPAQIDKALKNCQKLPEVER